MLYALSNFHFGHVLFVFKILGNYLVRLHAKKRIYSRIFKFSDIRSIETVNVMGQTTKVESVKSIIRVMFKRVERF